MSAVTYTAVVRVSLRFLLNFIKSVQESDIPY